MLTIFGGKTRYCDGLSRRSFLRIGAVGLGIGGVGSSALALPDILKAQGKTGSGHKALINIFLGGGPPHQDMWDIKTEAPKEIRGEFKPIRTAVPGVNIGECFPRIAAMMDKFVAIRSVVGAAGGHDAVQCMTGWRPGEMRSLGGRPCIGSAVGKLYGPVDPSVPSFVGLAARTQHVPWSDPGHVGFVGPAYSPFKPDGQGMENMKLNGVTLDRLGDRRTLLKSFDRMRSDMDATGGMSAMDTYGQRALDVLASSKLLDALDVTKEDAKTVARYGDGKPYQFQYDGAPTVNDQLLMARRLVEAGVRVVSLSFGRWDSHGKNFDLVRDHGAKLDQCVTALVEDLQARGMLDDVTVIAWGEFGRTPRINNGAGRDHWPQVSCALMAGGGMKTGQAIGSTNPLGEYAVDRPVHFQEIFATLYRNLGVNTATTTITDPTGRPQYLIEADPLKEVL